MTPDRLLRSARLGARAVAVLMLAGLAACATSPSPIIGNDDPQVLPLHGIDVSYYQGDIDWPEVRRGGVAFAYMKATEGGDYKDPKFAENWEGARQAGLARGAYHFYYWCRSAADQIAWFKTHVPVESEALPPVLDVEWNGHSKTCPKKVPRAVAISEMKIVLEEMWRHYGKRPVIYTDITFYNDIMSEGFFSNYPLWVRSINRGHPTKRYNRDWHFWQYTSVGRVPGIKANVDRNAFHGTLDAWKAWAAGG